MKKFSVCLICILLLCSIVLAACEPTNTPPTTGDGQPPKPFDDYEDYYTEDGQVNLEGKHFDIDAYLDSYLDTIVASEYRDYATLDADYDYHIYLRDQGMKLAYYNPSNGIVEEVACRDHEAVSALVAQGVVSASKPTVIFIHGIQMESQGGPIYFFAEQDVLSSADPDLQAYLAKNGSSDVVHLNRLFLEKGFNVFNFQYHRFADEPVMLFKEFTLPNGEVLSNVPFATNMLIENKVWSTEGVVGMRYRLPSGKFNDGTNLAGVVQAGAPTYNDPAYAIDFSIAEYFAAEWIRCLSYFKQIGVDLSQSEVRFAGHSMGCEVTTAGTFLLTELVRVGQIDDSYLPDRVCLQDGYMGVYISEKLDFDQFTSESSIADLANMATITVNIPVSWSGKTIARAGTSPLMACAIRSIARKDIAIEFYLDEYGMVVPPSGIIKTLFFRYCAVAYYNGSFGTKIGGMGTGTHNSVRSIYSGSIVDAVPVAVDAYGNVIGSAISASSTTQEIKDRMGHIYRMIEGAETGRTNDDVFEQLQ